MARIIKLTFNPFQENSWIVYNDQKECWIIDPGNSNDQENQHLAKTIKEHSLTPIQLYLTHAHIDHVMGTQFVFDKYGLTPIMHKSELPILEYADVAASMYGIPYTKGPIPTDFIVEGQTLHLGDDSFDVLFTPGHSPGSVSFYSAADKFCISGDVIMMNSIGRTDLPLCNHQDLIDSIKTKIYSLPNDVMLCTGHGGESTVGDEKKNNQFVKG